MPSKYLDDDRQRRYARLQYDFDDGLEGRRILVAGGTGGLGSAVAARLLHDGAEVVVGFASDPQRAEGVAEGLRRRYGDRVGLARGDVTTKEGRETLIEALGTGAAQPYGVVVCAGDPARVSPDELDDAPLLDSLRVNYTGPILLARAVAARLAEADTPGAVVLFSSMQGMHPFPGSLAYAGPKSALVMGARILAQEFGGAANVRVNVVAPGVTAAGMALASIGKGKYDPFVDEGVIPRFGLPEDVARAVSFLMAPDNYTTGQVVVVDGGLTLRRGT